MAFRIPKLLWVFILLSLLPGCDFSVPFKAASETRQPASEAAWDASVAVVAIEDKIVAFECLDTREDCPLSFDVTEYALLDWPYHLASIYYGNPSSIFMLLYTDAKVPWERSVIHYNPQTQEVKSVKLPRELAISSSTTAGGRLVLLGDQNGPVYILDEKLSIRKIEVGSSINMLNIMNSCMRIVL
jgi:hypothetical protein